MSSYGGVGQGVNVGAGVGLGVRVGVGVRSGGVEVQPVQLANNKATTETANIVPKRNFRLSNDVNLSSHFVGLLATQPPATQQAIHQGRFHYRCLGNLRHPTNHFKGLDQNIRPFPGHILVTGLTAADGDLKTTWLDHPSPLIVNQ